MMKKVWILAAACAMAVGGMCGTAALAQAVPPRQMENLGRGVVAVSQGEGKAWVGWRLLGTEPEGIAFNVYRQAGRGLPQKINGEPIRNATWFVDERVTMPAETSYFVRPVTAGQEGPQGKAAKLATAGYLSIPMQNMPQGYAPNDCSVGDLDGDGEYELIVHQAGRGKDNSQAGETDPPVFQAYRLDGTLLWTLNLGKNIREGAHYTQFMVYDLDGDGKAEMICKTADGTTDAAGKVIGDANADHRNQGGYILQGPEYLTVFEGATGKALYTTNYTPPRGELKPWGDTYGNRMDRFLACIAYLDGVHPSVVMCRGYYTRTVLAAYDWKDGKLVPRWVFDSDDPNTPNGRRWRGQGNHNLSVADVDGDGRDEIVYGAMCIDDNGRGLWNTGYGHGDALHVSDLDPDRPGLEVFDIQERFSDAGCHFNDARTGETLWKKPSVKAGNDGEGPGRGLAADIDPRHRGYECWVAGAGINGLFDAKGNLISEKKPRSCNFVIQWDGDPMCELLDGNHIDKWDWQTETDKRLFTAPDCQSNNGTKSTPALSADILGDWREEVIWRTRDNKELRIYTTTIPTQHRFYTLMHDPQYRLSIAWQNVAYNQPPHTSFYMGDGMKNPPRPNITLVGAKAPAAGGR
jgi:rhamnogalacturonan endolyase